MNENQDVKSMRMGLAIVRIVLGVILLVTWYDNLTKDVYTAGGIEGLFDWIFNQTGGGAGWYRAIINSTVLAAPGVFAGFQLVAELLLALGLLVGGLTRLAGLGAAVFFFNLFLAYYGGSEWIWTYVLLTAAATAVSMGRAGRLWGLDQWLLQQRGEPSNGFLW